MNMNNNDRLPLIYFINSIPDDAFDWPPTSGTVYKNDDFRLDMQIVSTIPSL